MNCTKHVLASSFNIRHALNYIDTSDQLAYIRTATEQNFTIPTETAQNVQADPINTAAPLAFYFIGIISAFLVLALRFLDCCTDTFSKGKTPSGFLGLSFIYILALSLFSDLCILIASAYLTAKAHGLVSTMKSGANISYIESPHVGSGFLGVAWGAWCFSLLSSFLLVWYFWVQKKVDAFELYLSSLPPREGGSLESLPIPPAYHQRGLDRVVSVDGAEERVEGTSLEMIAWIEDETRRELRDREGLPEYEHEGRV